MYAHVLLAYMQALKLRSCRFVKRINWKSWRTAGTTLNETLLDTLELIFPFFGC